MYDLLLPTSKFLVPNEELLEEERNKIRVEYENEMLEMREKYTNEQKSKAKMAAEVKTLLLFVKIINHYSVLRLKT